MADDPEDTGNSDETQASLREKRVDINEEFESIDQFLAEYISNISQSGAFIRTRDPWPVGTRLQLRFTILADDLEILEGVATVVRVDREPSGMGVEFDKLTDASSALIKRILSVHARTRKPTLV